MKIILRSCLFASNGRALRSLNYDIIEYELHEVTVYRGACSVFGLDRRCEYDSQQAHRRANLTMLIMSLLQLWSATYHTIRPKHAVLVYVKS